MTNPTPERGHQPGSPRLPRWLLTGWLATVASCPTHGQLAITEVMSNPINSPAGDADFWELTNFGSDPVALDFLMFGDNVSPTVAKNLGELWRENRLPEPPVIGPGETLLFVRTNHDSNMSVENFRNWWGPGQLSPDVKVLLYTRFGFNEIWDIVNLWQGPREQPVLVHRVELFESPIGRTFTYNPLTGEFDRFSTNHVAGAFQAAATEDVGSPGRHTGPAPLRLLSGPANADVDGGTPVAFTARAQGLPPPRYQWRFNNQPIPGATSSTCLLAAATAADAGDYTVEIDNGLERIVSLPATLTVNTNPSPATIVRPPVDSEVTLAPPFIFQTAVFRVETRGYPPPTLQWEFNGAEISGANSNVYKVTVLNQEQAGLYSVRVANPLGHTNANARLRIIPQANLVLTEAMAWPSQKDTLGHATWWELTNFGTNEVNLRGYRWDDLPSSCDRAIVVTNDIILAPGRSAIFVSDMTPDAFRRWWGQENLPADLPIISHVGNGLSPLSEEVKLWNASAQCDCADPFLFSVSFADQHVGRSSWFDPASPESEFGAPSVLGERHAFRAAESDDVGSPGWTSNAPRILAIRHEAAGVAITWRSLPGRTYELRRGDTPDASEWSLISTNLATSDTATAIDTNTAVVPQRFYRVVLLY